MKTVIIARYGEIHLKGNNKGLFLSQLLKNLKSRLSEQERAKVIHEDERIIISGFEDEIQTIEIVTTTFGIVSASPAFVLPSVPEAILEYLKTQKIGCTFKVNVNRANKQFPIKSPEFAPLCGGAVLEANPQATVNVQNPDTTIHIDIRKQQTFVYTRSVEGFGGLPVGVSGRAVVMLSGGIDSPVATFLSAKRGLAIDFVHFATPPYTSDLALEKIYALQRQLERYVGKTNLYIIPFTEISLAIRKNCDLSLMITLMRRFMVRIAEAIGLKKHDCIITGENLAQVASQTIAGITSNNFCATTLPILRPLITYDKVEIIALAKKIGTYEISIQAHEDCCTIFVPQNPAIKPRLNFVEKEEAKLDVKHLVQRAVEGSE